jgi:aryl-alcohol dehydrogenase-like predicted oxidoreductase
MRYREFGATGAKVSEIGFGAWGIGGGYGSVEKAESLNALSRAEELGCNFIDSALVYGDSESVLGEFLRGRRSRWFVATKYSGQGEGMTATIEKQLKLLRTDAVDFYQLHWCPRRGAAPLFVELEQLKRTGKARFIGVSLSSAVDIRDFVKRSEIDGFQIAFNLLQPEPLLTAFAKLRDSRKAVVVHSALRQGFLTGKYARDAAFTDRGDQRHRRSSEELAQIVDKAERFRFLERETGSMVAGAARYPLSFAQVSSVLLGTKSATQAECNFREVPGAELSAAALVRIHTLQLELGLRGRAWQRWLTKLRLLG